MTETLSIAYIKTTLESKGYKVVIGPPNLVMDNQVSIEIKDMKLTTETPTLYNLYTFVNLGISTSDPETIEAKLKKIVEDVENSIHLDNTIGRGSFYFEEDIILSKPGELYNIILSCHWFKQIQITI